MSSRTIPSHYILKASEATNFNHAWRLPPRDALALLQPGFIVKICIGTHKGTKPEAPWVIILSRSGSKFRGTINNHLAKSVDHGLVYGSNIDFKLENIIDIMFERPKPIDPKKKEFRII